MSNPMIQRRMREILMQQAMMGSGRVRRSGSKTTKRVARSGSVRRSGSKTAKKVTRSRSKTTKRVARKKIASKYKRVLGKSKTSKTSRSGTKRGGSSGWIAFVKRYAKDNRIGYKEALSEAAPAYHKYKMSKGGVLVGGKRRSSRSRGGVLIGGRKKMTGSKTARKSRMMRAPILY
jgi:hypothetical protein